MGTAKLCLRWNDFESNISVAFRELRQDKDLFDVTLACDDEQIQAHKVILSACSPFFRNVLRKNPHQHPLLYLKGVKYTDLQAVLNFMYHGEVNVAQEELNSFLAVAEDLCVKGLTQNNSGGVGGSSGSRKENNYSVPKSTPAPKSAPRSPPSDPTPPPKRPRPNPPSIPSPSVSISSPDPQPFSAEDVPVKVEPSHISDSQEMAHPETDNCNKDEYGQYNEDLILSGSCHFCGYQPVINTKRSPACIESENMFRIKRHCKSKNHLKKVKDWHQFSVVNKLIQPEEESSQKEGAEETLEEEAREAFVTGEDKDDYANYSR